MELELTVTLDDDAKGEHCSQFSFSVDYDGASVESAFLCSASPKQKLNTLNFTSYSTHSKVLNPFFYRLTHKLLIINI